MSLETAEVKHVPVLADEVVSLLEPLGTGVVVDATLGAGGHSERILSEFRSVRLIGIDQDEEAIQLAHRRLERFADRMVIVKSNFADIDTLPADASIRKVDAIIADLGVSSMQFDSKTRGFSFRYDAPLDMRMDASADTETVADILATRSESEIADIIYRFGEERRSRRIARRIVEERNAGRPVRTTKELADLVTRSVPYKAGDATHPATRTFQALRIAVNRELDVLGSFIDKAIELLTPGGTLVIITFHSLEDRIVKLAFQRNAGRCACPPRMPKCMCGAQERVEILTKKPIMPRAAEIDRNPKARSAKLRAARKL